MQVTERAGRRCGSIPLAVRKGHAQLEDNLWPTCASAAILTCGGSQKSAHRPTLHKPPLQGGGMDGDGAEHRVGAARHARHRWVGVIFSIILEQHADALSDVWCNAPTYLTSCTACEPATAPACSALNCPAGALQPVGWYALLCMAVAHLATRQPRLYARWRPPICLAVWLHQVRGSASSRGGEDSWKSIHP